VKILKRNFVAEKNFVKGDIVGAGISKRISDGYKAGYHLAVVSRDNLVGNLITFIKLFTHSPNAANQTIDQSKLIGYAGKQLDAQTYLSDDEFEALTKELRKKEGKYELG